MSLKNLVITNERLGEGGFGSVFVCELGGKKVAAKKLSQSEREIDNLVREASRLKRLQYGKHIAYIYGITMKNEKLYMVMEYSECGDLQNYLKANKESVTYEQKIFFCRGILLGLLYCHSMKIFHGDIKCSNVILGKNLEPKLTDFGLSMTVDNIEYYSKLYDGSLYWVAPELLSIKEDEAVYPEFIADPYPCDVYSLGAVFCEISYDGTTQFIDSDDPGQDVILGIVSPKPKEEFLEGIISFCCCYERNARITLDTCLVMLDIVSEEELPDFVIDDEWQRIQQRVKTNSKLELPPSFVLCRPRESLVVGSSNLSLVEYLCINDCRDAVEYMISLDKLERKQLEWLYNISELCKALNVSSFFRKLVPRSRHTQLCLSNLMDSNPEQFIESLIKAGADCRGNNSLQKAIERRYNKIVKLLVHSKNSIDGSAIHHAIEFENVEAVSIIAASGVDLNLRSCSTGYTPLLAAVNSGNAEIVKILLGFNADVHIGNQHTPLQIAALNCDKKIVELLVSSGVTIDIKSNEWLSLLQDLKRKGKQEVIQFIFDFMGKNENPAEISRIEAQLTAGAMSRNVKSVESTQMRTKIQKERLEAVQKLVNNEAHADMRDYNIYAPLHQAAMVGDEKTVRCLIKTGADVDVKTLNVKDTLHPYSTLNYCNKSTPLHIAVSRGHLGVLKLLIKSGADFSLENEAGQTIMDIAVAEGRKDIEMIIQKYTPVTDISLVRAAKIMSAATVKALISSKRELNTRVLSDCLCAAICNKNIDTVMFLMKRNVNVNYKYEGKNALEWAVSSGYFHIAQILTEKVINIHAKVGFGKTLLFQYVNKSCADVVQFLIDKNVNVNVRDYDGNTSLHFARDSKVIEILFNAGADVNAKNQNGITPLIQFVRESNAETVQFLVDKGADVNARDKDGNTPLHFARDKKIIEILIEAGAKINAKNKDEKTVLFYYVQKSDTEMVHFLINSGADVSTKNKDGYALIYFAKSKEMIETLIDADIDVNLSGEYGRALLFQYVKESQEKIVQFLIEKGAKVNIQSGEGCDPILYAKDKKIIEALIRASSDVNAKNSDGRTILFQFIRESNADIVQFLVEKGADINARDNYRNTPIFFARDREIAKFLVGKGADINARNIFEQTPLFECVAESQEKIVQFLVDNRSDINAKDICGDMPVHHSRSIEITKILIANGADINSKDIQGRILFDILLKEQNIELSNANYNRKKVSELLEYLKTLK